jgi:flavin-dependent thymidylate synthase
VRQRYGTVEEEEQMTEHPVKWGDAQQYHAEPHPNYMGEEQGVMPSVHLLWMTPDPLGAVAAMAEMYKGNVIRSLEEVTDAMRRQAFEDVQKTHLKAPLEAVKLHFMIEGVDRAFTHQHVRQRTAVFAQESMRFAIPGELTEATTLPPSLAGTERPTGESDYDNPAQRWRSTWDNALQTTDAAYHMLVETGMPAEEARGLLPHATATRLNYVTDLRNLSDHAGNRLCTQAQFHWRLVFALLMDAIKEYTPDFGSFLGPNLEANISERWDEVFRWQFEGLAQSALFRPVCYQLNYCPFQASFDRACTIRERVQQKSQAGVPSDRWDQSQKVPEGDCEWDDDGGFIFRAVPSPPISPAEWLLNPGAARVR